MDIEVYESTTAELDAELLVVYAAIYADAPYNETPEDVAEFAAVWPRIRSEPGFRLVVARVDGVLVGMAEGYVLRPDCGWWPEGVAAEVAREWITDGVGRSFGVDELGIVPAWRGRGVGRRLHAALLAGRRESRAVLWARVDAPVAQAVYAGWGYRAVARVDKSNGRSYDVLCLDRG